MSEFNIVLTASGYNDINNFVSNEMREFFSNISPGKKIMILANAAPEGTGNFVARENVRDNFLKAGATQVDIVDLTDENITSILKYDVIYALGGDPTYLIGLNKNLRFKELLLQFLENGVYIGESAGSMILCDDLKWAYDVKKGTKPKYDIELDTYRGLDLTDYKVFPHWNKVENSVKEKAVNYENTYGIKFTKLNDGEFILTIYKRSQRYGK